MTQVMSSIVAVPPPGSSLAMSMISVWLSSPRMPAVQVC